MNTFGNAYESPGTEFSFIKRNLSESDSWKFCLRIFPTSSNRQTPELASESSETSVCTGNVSAPVLSVPVFSSGSVGLSTVTDLVSLERQCVSYLSATAEGTSTHCSSSDSGNSLSLFTLLSALND